MELGFIGVGTITEAVVTGLQGAPGVASIHLSPRSETVSRRLAATYGNVVREASNAAVVERSDLVVLAVRPDQIDDALQGLTFRSEQIVVSLLAAVPHAEIAARVAPAATVCRMVPLPPITRHKGPILIYPAVAPVIALFDALGEVIVPANETEMRDLACASGFMSSYLELQSALTGWLVGHAVDGDKASRYVRAMLAALSDVALDAPTTETDALPGDHETKGGLNERVRRRLKEEGWFDAAGRALGALQVLKGGDLTAAPRL